MRSGLYYCYPAQPLEYAHQGTSRSIDSVFGNIEKVWQGGWPSDRDYRGPESSESL